MAQRRAVVAGNVEGGPRLAAKATDCASNQSTQRRLQRLAAHCGLECFILAALPRLAITQRLLSLNALGNVDIDSDDTHNAAVLVVLPASPGTEPSNLAGRKNDSEFQVERLMIPDSGIAVGFDARARSSGCTRELKVS